MYTYITYIYILVAYTYISHTYIYIFIHIAYTYIYITYIYICIYILHICIHELRNIPYLKGRWKPLEAQARTPGLGAIRGQGPDHGLRREAGGQYSTIRYNMIGSIVQHTVISYNTVLYSLIYDNINLI